LWVLVLELYYIFFLLESSGVPPKGGCREDACFFASLVYDHERLSRHGRDMDGTAIENDPDELKEDLMSKLFMSKLFMLLDKLNKLGCGAVAEIDQYLSSTFELAADA
jgi:hypothetical protein